MGSVRTGVLSIVLLLAGCASTSSSPLDADDQLIQAVGFDGTLHYTLPLSDASRAKLQAAIAAARTELVARPGNEAALVWYGRRLAYAGMYQQAVINYTRGIQIHPDSSRLRRHRGHRFITLRLLHPAIEDLTRADELSRDVANEVEPDGMPNPAGIPLSTTRGNILYHLALAQYLSGASEQAADTWQRALEIARNDDTRVACLYWLVLSEGRLGDHGRVLRLLESVTAGMTIIENDQYHQLLLYFKGELDEQAVRRGAIEPGGTLSPATNSATILYGLGAWAAIKGDMKTATARFREAVSTPQWAAFGYIAAEADLARIEGDWAAYEAATY